MTDKDLLYWIFAADMVGLSEREFKTIDAPDWVWPAYEEALKQFRDLERREVRRP